MIVVPGLAIVATLMSAPEPQNEPPAGPHRLAYTFTSQTEVGFMDLASLQRTGDVVEGWSLNVFAEPYKPEYAAVAAPVHWSRVQIDCAAQTARFTHGMGLVDGAVVFSAPIEMDAMAVAQGWMLDADYACNGATPERPIVASVQDAIEQSTAIMTSDAWDTTTP